MFKIDWLLIGQTKDQVRSPCLQLTVQHAPWFADLCMYFIDPGDMSKMLKWGQANTFDGAAPHGLVDQSTMMMILCEYNQTCAYDGLYTDSTSSQCMSLSV
jgi:hypothetical protein